MKSLIVYGPKGCGKTTRAAELVTRHGLKHVCELDNFITRTALQDTLRRDAEGFLFLTSGAQEAAEGQAKHFGLRVMSYETAMRTITVDGVYEFNGVVKPLAYKIDWKEVEKVYAELVTGPNIREQFEQQFQQTPSPTFQALNEFTGAMARKLEKHRMEKGDRWQTAPLARLQDLFNEELTKPNPDMVDIANYAMMIWGLTNIQPGHGGRKTGFSPLHAAPYDVELGSKINAGCDAAPEGWKCTRAYGHTGPCAAVEQ
jgi:hypothetical protein